MLTYDDNPTIKNAIFKRLDKELGVKVVDIIIRDCSELAPANALMPLQEILDRRKTHVPHIEVGVWVFLIDTVRKDGEGMVDIRGFFDLPAQFTLDHLHNEIDEIAESCKKARKETAVTRLLHRPGLQHQRQSLGGTGLRGRWPA